MKSNKNLQGQSNVGKQSWNFVPDSAFTVFTQPILLLSM